MKYLKIILLSQLLAISVLLPAQSDTTIPPEYTSETSQIEQNEPPQELIALKEPEPVTEPAPVKPVETRPIIVEVPVVATPTKPTENTTESIVNDERETNGLNRLETNQKLRNSACAKAQHMLDYQYWAHDAPGGTTPWFFITQAGYDYMIAGENLAKGYPTPQATVIGWLGSPAHKENMLSRNYLDQGICSKQGLHLNEQLTITVQHLGIQQ